MMMYVLFGVIMLLHLVNYTNLQVRSERVAILSRMFCHPNSNLHTTYRKLFEAFLKRFSDKKIEIRETMLDFANYYFENYTDHAADISSIFKYFKMF